MIITTEEMADLDRVIDCIEDKVVTQLKKDFKKIGLKPFEINNISRNLKKIKYTPVKETKEHLLKIFLLSHYQHYKEKETSPLNTFSLSCGNIYSQNFLPESAI